ncbi:MAG: hypothetical protein IPL32_15445 [Chloracidobacterium sp.]|nr:hypothetical protein [Chloracidobacterium sp.]
MNKIKIVLVIGFLAFGIGLLFIDNGIVSTAESFSGGPPVSFTGAPGEITCTDCHTQNAGIGLLSITAPPNYIPGQTYQISVQHSTTDATRLRWGFQMTALDGTNNAAGSFTSTDGFTYADFGNSRFYVAHTQTGTFAGTGNGATWTFDWTAPATDVGPVTFYAAGIQANNNNGRLGDQTYTATAASQIAPSPTSTPTPTVAISGTITYGNAAGSPNPRFVSNVLLSGAGSPNVSTTSDFPDGSYSLSGFGAGSYAVTPTKSGGQNGITSFDAARIAQHVAGAFTLTGNQLIVADTSDNGQITSFDAAAVASYVIQTPPSGVTGNWKFLPANKIYASVLSSISGEDYSALLMGEVTGNWTSSAARSAKTSGPEKTMNVSLPNIEIGNARDMIVPVSVQGIVDKGVISYEFDLRYDPSVIQPLKKPVDVVGTVSRGLSAMVNSVEPGLLRVAVYGAMPIEGDGLLLNLRFTAIGKPGSISPLTWERLMFNEGESMVNLVDGKIDLF